MKGDIQGEPKEKTVTFDFKSLYFYSGAWKVMNFGAINVQSILNKILLSVDVRDISHSEVVI